MTKLEDWYDLHGRVAFLTGATGFIGPTYARALSERGASVVVVDLKEEHCQQLAAQLKDTYHTDALALRVDVTKPEDVAVATAKVVEHYGRLDILINNAAYHQLEHIAGGNEATLEDFPLGTWQKTLDVNLTGALLCCQEAGKVMLKK